LIALKNFSVLTMFLMGSRRLSPPIISGKTARTAFAILMAVLFSIFIARLLDKRRPAGGRGEQLLVPGGVGWGGAPQVPADHEQ